MPQPVIIVDATGSKKEYLLQNSDVETTVTLGDTFATNQPFQLVEGIAQPVTSLQASPPYVDGITLSSGSVSSVVNAAMTSSNIYATPLALGGSDGEPFFLGQTGLLSFTPPSAGAGDVWSVPLGRRISSTSFIYNPGLFVRL